MSIFNCIWEFNLDNCYNLIAGDIMKYLCYTCLFITTRQVSTEGWCNGRLTLIVSTLSLLLFSSQFSRIYSITRVNSIKWLLSAYSILTFSVTIILPYSLLQHSDVNKPISKKICHTLFTLTVMFYIWLIILILIFVTFNVHKIIQLFKYQT